MRRIVTTVEIPFDWQKAVKSKPVLLKAIKEVNNWPTEWTKGYISSLGNMQSYKGGKLTIYKSREKADSGYMIVNGYDELNKLFEVKS